MGDTLRERTIRIGVMRGREPVRDALDAIMTGGQENDPALPRLNRYQPQWCFAADQLVDAVDIRTGRCLALMAGQARVSSHETFMLLEPLMPAMDPVTAALERRMLAGLLMRLLAHEELPAAVVARTSSPGLCNAMWDVGRKYDGVRFFPVPDTNVLPMATAGLAQRISRVIGMRPHDGRSFDPTGLAPPSFVMLDLREADETVLMERARKIYRTRLPRGPTTPAPDDNRRRTLAQ